MIEYNLEAELKKCIKSMHSGYIPKKDADHIRGVMERCLKWITDPMPHAEPKREWHPVDTPPTHHRDVIVRGIEAIGNVTVHKVMQWDVDTWRPTNYAPSISWKEWSEIDG